MGYVWGKKGKHYFLKLSWAHISKRQSGFCKVEIWRCFVFIYFFLICEWYYLTCHKKHDKRMLHVTLSQCGFFFTKLQHITNYKHVHRDVLQLLEEFLDLIYYSIWVIYVKRFGLLKEWKIIHIILNISVCNEWINEILEEINDEVCMGNLVSFLYVLNKFKFDLA